MTATLQLNEKAYGQLLREALPRLIRAAEDYDRLAAELERPDELEASSMEERELAELLTALIEEYEAREFPVRKSTPRQTLLHLMEARGLKQKDLRKLFGSKGVTSEVVHGKRSISKGQAKKLATLFHVTVDLFI